MLSAHVPDLHRGETILLGCKSWKWQSRIPFSKDVYLGRLLTGIHGRLQALSLRLHFTAFTEFLQLSLQTHFSGS